MHLGICKIRSYRDTVYCPVSLYERILHIPRLHIREPVQQKLETKWASIRLSGNINKTTRKSNCLPFLNNELGISRPIDFSVKVISYPRIVNHSAVRTKCTVCLHVSPLSPISYDMIILFFLSSIYHKTEEVCEICTECIPVSYTHLTLPTILLV